MSSMVEYQVVLSDGGANTYASTSVFAVDDDDARRKAKNWVKSLDDCPDGAWLVLNLNGRGITLKPGNF